MITDNLPARDQIDSLDLPEFGEEDLERLNEAREYIEALGRVLEMLAGYESELEELRNVLQELIELIRELDLPEAEELPETADGWKSYLEEKFDLVVPLPEEVYDQLARLGRIANQLGLLKDLLEILSDLMESLPDLDMSASEMIEEIKILLDKAEEILAMIETAGPMIGQVGDLIDGLFELQRGYAELHRGLTRYIDEGVGGLVEGIEGSQGQPGLSSGTAEYVGGVSQLKDGLDQYYSDGLVPFGKGLGQLDSGASRMRDETSGLRALFEEAIREKLDEFSNEGFETVSFVSDQNKKVGSVQFVFMTEEIPPSQG